MRSLRTSRLSRAALWRLITLVVFVVVATLAVVFVPLPAVENLRSAVTAAGALGVVVFIVGYALFTLAPVPKAVLSVLAGLVWGFWFGAITVYIAALIGAALAFLLGRWLGRDAVERLMGARVARIDELLRHRGFLAVLGLRLVPVVPFTAINYVAGLTAIRRRDYALGTAVGIIPGDAAYVAIGAYGLQPGWELWAAIGALGVLTVAGAVLGRGVARRSRSKATPLIGHDHV